MSAFVSRRGRAQHRARRVGQRFLARRADARV